MITENLSTLKIHKLTQAQYDREFEAGRIEENALYLTPYEANPIAESDEYSGCYYRIIDGETEWINPPMIYGVRYRTTERHNGMPVYVFRANVKPEAPTVGTAYDALDYIGDVIGITGAVKRNNSISDINNSFYPCQVGCNGKKLTVACNSYEDIDNIIITLKFTLDVS